MSITSIPEHSQFNTVYFQDRKKIQDRNIIQDRKKTRPGDINKYRS